MKHHIAALLIAAATPASAAAAAQIEAVTIPAYAAVPHARLYATESAYNAARRDQRYAMHRFSYSSDGLEVFAYVYGPTRAATRRPVIVFNRGSYTWPDGFSGELLTMAHRLAQHGYVVVAPMYRGSGGAAGRDEMGGSDVDDLLNLEPVIGKIPGADPSKVYLYGESRGGMMVYQALRDGFHARAAAVVGAFTDLDGMLADARWAQAGAQIWPDLSANRSAIVSRRSAVRWADKINVPILILHGAADREVPPDQSLRMTSNLLNAKKHVSLAIIDGEDHVLSGSPAARDTRVVDWFQGH